MFEYDEKGAALDICENYAGHEWFPAGGEFLICSRCESEMWDESDLQEYPDWAI